MLNKKYCVVGIGYVGLPCAIMLADSGCKVLGFDISQKAVDSVNDGTIHIEPELKDLLLSPAVRRNLRASTTIQEADVFIVAVPTPVDHRKKVADLETLIRAVNSIATVVKKGDLIIIESTVPPLTIRDVVTPILEKTRLAIGEDIYLAHCPERLLPGNIVYEILNNNRIIGGVNGASAEKASDVYRVFVKGQISLTDDVTAELCKLMENTYRDVNIALANELSEVCRDIGVDVHNAIDLANLHPRVNLLKPGIGVGGHCLPIDPWFIHEVSPYHSTMIITARHINDGRPAKIAAKIRREIASDMTQSILILGKTYKIETNDIRKSPAQEIYEILLNDGYNIKAYDSEVDEDVSLKAIVEGCSCVFVLVPHKNMMEQFNNILKEMRSEGKNLPAVFEY